MKGSKSIRIHRDEFLIGHRIYCRYLESHFALNKPEFSDEAAEVTPIRHCQAEIVDETAVIVVEGHGSKGKRKNGWYKNYCSTKKVNEFTSKNKGYMIIK